MKMLLAIALLFGFASFTSAHAEWEILDSGTAVYAGTTTTQTAAVASSGTTTQVAQTNSASR
jgi:uncharacterized membrane protein YadS